MRKTLVKLLVLASTLIFIVAFAACSTEETADLPPYPDIASLDHEAAMAYPETTAFDSSTGTFDTSTLRLEEVLAQTRIAMGEIVSYKSRGTTMWRSSTSRFGELSGDFSELAANGNYRFGSEFLDPYDDDFHLISEWRSVGNQVFHLNSNQDWEEAVEPLSERRTESRAAENFLRMLDSDGIQLRSASEITEDRTMVYRLEFTEQQEQPVRDGFEIKTMKTTLLVSRDSFRIVTVFRDKHDEIYLATAASEIGPETHSRWTEGIMTTQYFDYNEPVVIEIPDQYTPWPGTVMLRR